MRQTNNFDFVRMVAAGSVLISHMWPLHHGTFPLGDMGAFGVFIFFSISGYLVSASWERDPNAFRFLARRALRIFPGLACAIAVAAFIVGPLVTSMPLARYIDDPMLLQYCESIGLYNMSFQLPGVFVHNPTPYSVNDSLWTIPMEALMYLGVVAMGIVLWRVKQARVPLLATLVVAGFALELRPLPDVNPELVRNAACFFYGALLWHLRAQIRMVSWAWAPACAFIALTHANAVQIWALLLLVPYVAVSMGVASTPVVRRAGRFGDFSYGLYIYAFLIQQTLMHLLPKSGFVAFFVASTTLSIAAGVASWHLIEKRAMQLKPRVAARGGALNEDDQTAPTPAIL